MPDKNGPQDNLPALSNDDVDSSLAYPPVKSSRILTVPIVASMLSKGYSQTKIAGIFNISKQAVNQFISKNITKLDAIKNFDDVITASIKDKVSCIIDALDERDIKKASLSQKMVGVAIGIEKIRLLQGESTSNVATLTHLAVSLEGKIRGKKPQDVGDNDGTTYDHSVPDNVTIDIKGQSE